MHKFFLALLTFSLFSLPVLAQERTAATILRTVDGDTLKVRIGKFDERVRMIGIDTPEKEANDKALRDMQRSKKSMATITAQGRLSWEHLNSLLKPGQAVSLEFDVGRTDRHNRLLAYVYTADGRMINELMLRDGYASPMTVPPNVRYSKRFVDAFTQARTQKRGLWAAQ